MLNWALTIAAFSEGVINEDRDVIQAILLNDLSESQKNLPQIKDGYAVLDPDWLEPRTQDYFRALSETRTSVLDNLIKSCNSLSWQKEIDYFQISYADIEEIKKDVHSLINVYAASSTSEVNSKSNFCPIPFMKWDPRIEVGGVSGGLRFRRKKQKFYSGNVRDDLKAVSKIRASRPLYSPNGKCAFVFLSFPWSMHAGVSNILLVKEDGVWTVALTDDTFYL